MRVLRAHFRNFRGFENATVNAAGHVVVVGEPGAGRSDLVEGLARVLSPQSTRGRPPTELDFYRRDKTKRAEVEVILGDLGQSLEQTFLDHLDAWDRERGEVVEDASDPTTLDREQYDVVLRLCYRARWKAHEDQGEHWVDYPRDSDPEAEHFAYTPRTDRTLLPFTVLTFRGRVLDLGPDGALRRLIDEEGAGFSATLADLETQIEALAGELSANGTVAAALERLVGPIRPPLDVDEQIPASSVVRFLPEGGSVSGLLRSLSPAVDLHDGSGLLPLARHGSTVTALFGTAQALAVVGEEGVVVADDFGEELDAASGRYLAAALRKAAAQVWLTTRRSHVAEAFPPEELVRLGRDASGARRTYRGRTPTTKHERLMARHWGLQLLPAMAARAVIVLEGPHDRAAFAALAERLHDEEQALPPSARLVHLIDAAAADGAGGLTAVPKLARATRELGLRTVALIDSDKPNEQQAKEVAEVERSADVVVRLPERHAIERALVAELPEPVVKDALGQLRDAFSLTLPTLATATGKDLSNLAVKTIKDANAHGQFVAALPVGTLPPLARAALEKALEAAIDTSKAGIIQL